MATPKKASSTIAKKAAVAQEEAVITAEEARAITVGALEAEIAHQEQVAALTAKLNAYDAGKNALIEAAVMLDRMSIFNLNEMAKSYPITEEVS